MSSDSFIIHAIYEDGVFRPAQPVPLSCSQRVTLTVQPEEAAAWPADAAQIYQDIADEDRRLAAMMLPEVRRTWPPSEAQS